MKRKITNFKIVNHGAIHWEYFNKHLDISNEDLSSFDHCYTGNGDAQSEAFMDCIEQLVDDGVYDPDSNDELRRKEESMYDDVINADHGKENLLYFLSILVKGE